MKTIMTEAQAELRRRLEGRGALSELARLTGLRSTVIRYIATGSPPRTDDAWAISQATGIPWDAWRPEAQS